MKKNLDLPDEVLKAEFPQIYMAKLQYEQQQANDNNQKTVFIDQDNDNFYLQYGDSKKATRYKLIDANKDIQRPYLADNVHLNADQMISNWGKLDDENIFDTTNKNWDEIRDYLQTVTRKINAILDFVGALEPYLDLLASSKDIDLTQILTGISDKYYKKTELDKSLKMLQKQINNLNNAISYKPDGNQNSIFPPSYTGDKQIDINDQIQDPATLTKIESMTKSLTKEDE